MSKGAQLYYPARRVGTYPDLNQDNEISVHSGFAVRLGISRRQLNLFRLLFIQWQYKNLCFMERGLYPLFSSLIGVYYWAYTNYPVSSPCNFRFAAQCFSFWKRSEKILWFDIFAWWSWNFPGMQDGEIQSPLQ